MNKTIEDKLDELKTILDAKASSIMARNVKVIRLFVRRDGFTNSETLKYRELTNEQFALLTRREYRIPVAKRISIAADEALPPYMDTDRIEFYPTKWHWNKKTLEIMYQER